MEKIPERVVEERRQAEAEFITAIQDAAKAIDHLIELENQVHSAPKGASSSTLLNHRGSKT